MIELALRELGAEVSPASVKTYASLLDDAIKMDSGEAPNEWGEFLNGLPGEINLSRCVQRGRKHRRKHITSAAVPSLQDAVVDVKSGVPEDEASRFV